MLTKLIFLQIHKHRFYELCDQYLDYIYTECSKVGDRVASAIAYKGSTKSVRLPDLTSIFPAELYALFLAIDVIRRSKLEKFSASLGPTGEERGGAYRVATRTAC